MSIEHLDAIFRPKSVAVIGATERPGSAGSLVMRNLIDGCFAGPIYPVNPRHAAVHGRPAVASVTRLPEPADLAVICTPAATAPSLVGECGEAGIKAAVVIAAGFAEAGSDGRRLQDDMVASARRFRGLRILGPNCLGVIAPHARLNASFAGPLPAAGHLAFISQSGAVCSATLDWAIDRGIGFSGIVSVGDMADVDFDDLIDWFGEDASTRAIVLYVESIGDARAFMSAARACSRTKPIIACKAGRTARAAEAVVSHSASLAGAADVYEAALRRAGVVTVSDIGQLFECAELLARQPAPRGERLAIVTNAGGPAILATDALIERGGELASLSPATQTRLERCLPPASSRGNPVDLLGDATPQRYADAMSAVTDDEGVDAVLAILTPQAMTDATGAAEAVLAAAKRTHKPILAAWMGGAAVREGRRRLADAGVADFAQPGEAIDAFVHLIRYARNLRTLYETPRETPIRFRTDRAAVHAECERLTGAAGLMTEVNAKSLLDLYGIPVEMPRVAATESEAVAHAARLGYPVVVKVLSPDVPHKTDIGGVALDLHGEEEVRSAYRRVIDSARKAQSTARIDGVAIERMIRFSDSHELILGARRDPTFGMTIVVGMGGVAAELLGDRAIELAPLNDRLAEHMLRSLRCWPLLAGYRGRPGVDVDRLVEVMTRLSYLVADGPAIRELDINPLLAAGERIVALDARAVIDRPTSLGRQRPCDHLAICPYPERFEREAAMRDGRRILLRPIRPEDEPMWHRMLAGCSAESLHRRFMGTIKGTTHQMAARYCFIDYDREMAIVAEAVVNGERELIGVGRLSAHPDHEWAEYAVLVPDAWQGRGLGGALTSYCIEVGRAWGLKRIVASTEADNGRMIRAFQRCGFTVRSDAGDRLVRAERRLEEDGRCETARNGG